ncbi:hypothetical protein ACJW30_06G012300 [Castanea mollissima]
MAESAVSLVIQNLAPLLITEAKLLKGIHEEVTNIKPEMKMIQSFLKDADIRAEKDDMSNVAKTRVKQVREEAYHIEDVIDECILHFAKQPHRQKHCFYFLQKIQGINRILKDIQKSGERYGFNAIKQGRSSIDAESDTWDPRMTSLFIEEAKVVGIESHRDKLINWLLKGSSNRMVFLVVGIGGLGKTILVRKVYDNDKVAPHFDCHDWIIVSRLYKMEELLRDMIKQFYKARKEVAPKEFDIMKVTSLIEELKHYLRAQRYVVIFDDVWDIEFWECIKCSFPENDKGSRIIITTRNEDVAPSSNESLDYYVYKMSSLPFEKAFELFCKKVFKHEGGQCLPDLVDISCGIVDKCRGLPLAIVAIGGLFSTKAKVVSEWHKVLDSLSLEFEINSRLRSITKILSFSYHDLPYNLKALNKEDFIGRIRCCQVHDMMHEVILSRSEELSFNLVSMTNYSNFEIAARCLSIQNNVNTHLQSITNSQTRSILLLRVDEVPNSFLSTCFANFKLMKIMDCEGAPIDYIPKEVGNLFHLRYLSLRDTKLPAEINGLRKLRYVVAYIGNTNKNFDMNFRQAVKIHNGIGSSSATLIAELGSLVLLRKLEIFKLKRENGIVLCTVLKEMSHLQSLLPEWIPKLKSITRLSLIWSRLMDDPLKLLQSMPILVELWLYDGYIGEQLCIERGGFQKLKNLGLRSLRGLNRLMIEEGALPLLDQLDTGPCPQLKQVPSGIHHLKSLKQLQFGEMPTEFVLSLQPDEGPNFGKVNHIPSVTFWYRTQGEYYKSYKLGDSELLEHLQS